MGFLSREKLINLGFKDLGENVLISDKASIYGADRISIGSNVRIDDFCILSATSSSTHFDIGSYIHIGCYSSLIGKGNIVLENFVNISSKVAVYSSSDDYSGDFLTNPMIHEKFTNVYSNEVFLGKHVIIGSGSVVMPGISIFEGAAIGALSFVNTNCKEYTIYAGTPIKKLKERKRNLIKKELFFLKNNK